MANAGYNKGKNEINLSNINWTSDTIKVLLVNSTYTFNADHDFVSSVTAGEITGVTNYARKTLTGFTVAEVDASDWSAVRCNDPSWTSLGGASNDTIDAIIVYKEVTNDADSILLLYIDTSTGSPALPYTTTGGDLTINISDLMRLA